MAKKDLEEILHNKLQKKKKIPTLDSTSSESSGDELYSKSDIQSKDDEIAGLKRQCQRLAAHSVAAVSVELMCRANNYNLHSQMETMYQKGRRHMK